MDEQRQYIAAALEAYEKQHAEIGRIIEHLRAAISAKDSQPNTTTGEKKRVWTDEMKQRQTELMRKLWADRRARQAPPPVPIKQKVAR